MQKTISLFLLTVLFFVGTQNAFGAPLIFKTQKQVKWGEYVEIANFDTSKYGQIRIFIESDDLKYTNTIVVSGVEESETFQVSRAEFRIQHNQIVDVPPSRTRILIKGDGKFILHVYGKS